MNFSIGLSGLQAAQQVIDLIGTNIANAGTDGYHRQDVKLAAASYGTGEGTHAGVEVAEFRRATDALLESELIRQRPLSGQVERELSTLETVESLFGDLDAEGLSVAIDRFFNALRELAGQPNSLPLQQQAVWAADAMGTHFANLGVFLRDLEGHVTTEALQTVEHINGLAAEVASLNSEIGTVMLRGGNANIALDRRDQALSELSDLVGVTVVTDPQSQAVSVSAAGTPLVMGNTAGRLEARVQGGNSVGISAEGAEFFHTNVEGGELGGLFALRNELIPELRSELDSLAVAIVQQINRVHVQGVGMGGPFTELAGTPAPTDAFGQWDAGLQAGAIFVRITDLDTGQVIRREVSVALDDTLADLAGAFDGLQSADGTAALWASAAGGALRIGVTDPARFRFDFLPAPLAEAAPPDWTGSAVPNACGIYEGAANDVYALTAVGGGQVGVDDIRLEVRNEAGALLRTVSLGDGYAPGDRLLIGDGVEVALGSGTVADGDTFSVRVLATTDETNILAAAGINTFLKGDSAVSIGVRPEVLDDPSRLAVSVEADMTDNANIRRLADVGGQPVEALGGKTFPEAYRDMVVGLGQEIDLRRNRLDGLETILRQLELRRDEVGGVDINEETARLMLFERMFQAVARYIQAQQSTLEMLGEVMM